jgi:CheY-like chemotaxis protein
MVIKRFHVKSIAEMNRRRLLARETTSMSDLVNPTGRLLSVLVVESTAETRRALEEKLLWLANVGVVASVGTGAKALFYLDRLRPDLVLINQISDINNLQLAEMLSRRSPKTKIIISSTYKHENIDIAFDNLRDCSFIPKAPHPRAPSASTPFE